MTKEELKAVALGIIEHRIFTDRHIAPADYAQMVPMVFLVLAFSDTAAMESIERSIGGPPHLVYEDMAKAGPRGVNGYPSFMSACFMNETDAKEVWRLVDEMKSALAAVAP